MNRQLFKSFFIAVLLFINLESYGQFNNDNKRWYNLHGKVRSCTETVYTLKRDSIAGKYVNNFDSVVFNNKAQIIETYRSNTVRDADINKRIFTSYKYDNKGNLIEQLYHDFDGKVEAKLIYSHVNAKKLVTLRIYFPLEKDSSRLSDKFKIDVSGRILEMYHYNEHFVQGVKYQYAKTVYKYNKKGLRVEELTYDLDGKEQSKRFTNYDEHSEMSEISFVWLPNQRTNYTMSFTYVKYDEHNNWLIRNRHINGKGHAVNERQIIYYK